MCNWSPQRRNGEGRWKEEIFEKIMAENVLNLMKTANIKKMLKVTRTEIIT